MLYRYVVHKQDLDTPGDFDVFVKMAREKFKDVVVTLNDTLYFNANPWKLKGECEARFLKTTWLDILTTSDLTPHTDRE